MWDKGIRQAMIARAARALLPVSVNSGGAARRALKLAPSIQY